MAAYKLSLKITAPDPDSPHIQGLVNQITEINNQVYSDALVDGLCSMLRTQFTGMMRQDLARVVAVTLEYEGPYHKVKRKR